MLILNVWHPDVVEFINAKREMGKITNANISVGITDSFMQAVEKDLDWTRFSRTPMTNSTRRNGPATSTAGKKPAAMSSFTKP